MFEKIFKIVPPETLAKIVAGVVYFAVAALGILGLLFTVHHYHTIWKEIILIIISVNLIGVLNCYFEFLSKDFNNLENE